MLLVPVQQKAASDFHLGKGNSDVCARFNVVACPNFGVFVSFVSTICAAVMILVQNEYDPAQ